MKELYGSMWVHFLVKNHFMCITTNGTLKKNGDAVMGRGNAKQATVLIPGIQTLLGSYLKQRGNVAGLLDVTKLDTSLVVFPVKHNWWERADIVLISQSATWLWGEAKAHPESIFHLPRPGCGNGQLDWDRTVKALVSDLPDNVFVHHLAEFSH